MKSARDLDGRRLWAVVAATVRPLCGRAPVASPDLAPLARSTPVARPAPPPTGPAARSIAAGAGRRPPQAIEPGRRRRLEGELEGPGSRVDLHGRTQDEARGILTRFILARHAEGRRSVLVITGKGALGQGVLRRRVPGWLGEPPLREVVAGLSQAHRRHGGEGALYVALRRRRV